MLLRIGIVLILVLIDWYVFQSVKINVKKCSERFRKVVSLIYWGIAAFSIILFGATLVSDYKEWPKAFYTYTFALIFITYFSKLFVVVFLILDDLFIFIRKLVAFIRKRLFAYRIDSHIPVQIPATISRLEFLNKVGIVVGMLPFVSLVYGMVEGAYEYRVRKIKLTLPNLPYSFNGLRIVQISDIHTGSFTSAEPLKSAVQLILKQYPDVILFTGDLVNEVTDEVEPYLEALKEIQAPMGVYSVLGNHDYGDYRQWPNKKSKRENFEKMVATHKELGWELLLNRNTYIQKDGAKIGLIGMENWSTHNRFRRYGDMRKAAMGMGDVPVKILMSHDPSHWEAEIIEKYKDVDLMLAGHTHGMQFGVEIPGFKWSPAAYMYKQWAGLYQKKNQYLYVNRGLGFIGYPGRVGILPEITVIELYNSPVV